MTRSELDANHGLDTVPSWARPAPVRQTAQQRRLERARAYFNAVFKRKPK